MRKKQLLIMVTAKEHKEFHAVAARRHKTLSELVREYLYKLLDEDKKEAAA